MQPGRLGGVARQASGGLAQLHAPCMRGSHQRRSQRPPSGPPDLDGQVGGQRRRNRTHVVHPISLALACAQDSWTHVAHTASAQRGALQRSMQTCRQPPCPLKQPSSSCARTVAPYAHKSPQEAVPALFPCCSPLPLTKDHQVDGGAKLCARVADAGRGRRDDGRVVQLEVEALYQRLGLRLHCCVHAGGRVRRRAAHNKRGRVGWRAS